MKRLIVLFALCFAASAATVSSITCAGQTATVNATAHGLVASQGFELTGTAAQFNGTVVSASTNSFTFSATASGVTCSSFTSGYTLVSPAVQIIDLPSKSNVANATVTFSYLMWFTTAYPTPLVCNLGTDGTTCPTSAWSGANAAQNAAIMAGTTVEQVGGFTVPASTTPTGGGACPGSTCSVTGLIQLQYNNMQVAYTAGLLAGGYCYNGTAWVTTCQ